MEGWNAHWCLFLVLDGIFLESLRCYLFKWLYLGLICRESFLIVKYLSLCCRHHGIGLVGHEPQMAKILISADITITSCILYCVRYSHSPLIRDSPASLFRFPMTVPTVPRRSPLGHTDC